MFPSFSVIFIFLVFSNAEISQPPIGDNGSRAFVVPKIEIDKLEPYTDQGCFELENAAVPVRAALLARPAFVLDHTDVESSHLKITEAGQVISFCCYALGIVFRFQITWGGGPVAS